MTWIIWGIKEYISKAETKKAIDTIANRIGNLWVT